MKKDTKDTIVIISGVIMFIICVWLNLISIDWIAGGIYVTVISAMHEWINKNKKEDDD